jgi:hypothetical protein
MHVGIVDDLAKHEVGDICAGDPRDHGRGANVDTVAVVARSRAVRQAGRTHNDPIDLAVLDDSLLRLVVSNDVAQQKRGDDGSADEAQLSASLTNAKKRQVHEAPCPVPDHRVDDVLNAFNEGVVATQRSRRPERAENRMLAVNDAFDRRNIRHVALRHVQIRGSNLQSRRVADKGCDLSALRQSLRDELVAGSSTGAEDDKPHDRMTPERTRM